MATAGTGWSSAGTARPTPIEQIEELRDLAGLERYEGFLHSLLDEGEVEMEAVRHRVIRFYGSGE